jgi:PHD/YefM family antitoxin component YafN of YafNO toxin-antitoxin module
MIEYLNSSLYLAIISLLRVLLFAILCSESYDIYSDTGGKQQEPVFVTKNGKGDMVVMSLALYEQQQALLELYQKLGEAEAQSLTGLPTISHQDFMKKLKDQLNKQKI